MDRTHPRRRKKGKTLKSVLDKYDYSFPSGRIAHAPASPRDAAKLLIYERTKRRVSFDTFRHLGNYLPQNALLILNDTKVIPARLSLTNATGGKVKILYLRETQGIILALSPKKLITGAQLFLKKKPLFKVLEKKQETYIFKPLVPLANLTNLFARHGTTPIPPYIHAMMSEKTLRKEYQSIFAKVNGSVAAPTASLHFTKRLFRELKRRGIEVRHITHHVGLGTFAPVTEWHLEKGILHEEQYEIPLNTIQAIARAKKDKRPIIAVGTTVIRTLESAADKNGRIKRHAGTTDLFIRPGYKFKVIDGLITNFHVPRSSLLMLVSALVPRAKLFSLYYTAMRRHFRFFSFGDGMLIM